MMFPEPLLSLKSERPTHFDRYYNQSGTQEELVDVFERARWQILAYRVPLAGNDAAAVVGIFEKIETVEANRRSSHLRPRAVLEVFQTEEEFRDVFPWETTRLCLFDRVIFTEDQFTAALLGRYELADGRKVERGGWSDVESVFPGISNHVAKLKVCPSCFDRGLLQCLH